MKRQMMTMVAVSLMGVCACDAMYAAPLHVRVPVETLFSRAEKLVKFDIRNDSDAPLLLRCGDNTMTVGAGKTMTMKLPVGSKVVTASATKLVPTGSDLVDVTTATDGVVISVR